MDIYNIISINRIKNNNKKNFTIPFNTVFFFILLVVKYFDVLPKHSA